MNLSTISILPSSSYSSSTYPSIRQAYHGISSTLHLRITTKGHKSPMTFDRNQKSDRSPPVDSSLWLEKPTAHRHNIANASSPYSFWGRRGARFFPDYWSDSVGQPTLGVGFGKQVLRLGLTDRSVPRWRHPDPANTSRSPEGRPPSEGTRR